MARCAEAGHPVGAFDAGCPQKTPRSQVGKVKACCTGRHPGKAGCGLLGLIGQEKLEADDLGKELHEVGVA